MKTRIFAMACIVLLLCLPVRAVAAAPAAADPSNHDALNEALRQAAMKGDLEGVKSLLAKGAEVDAPSEFGATALIFAADRGHLDVVRLLIDKGADVNRKDTTYDSSPIGWAAYNGQAAVVGLLLEKGASDAGDTLDAGIERDHMEVVKVVLASGKVSKEALSSALASAKTQGKTEVADLLVKAGAVPPPKASSVLSADTMASYAGAYRNEAGFQIAISVDDGRLMVTMQGRPPMELSPKESNLFALVGAGPVTVSFNLEEGHVTGITVKPPPTGAVFKRVMEATK